MVSPQVLFRSRIRLLVRLAISVSACRALHKGRQTVPTMRTDSMSLSLPRLGQLVNLELVLDTSMFKNDTPHSSHIGQHDNRRSGGLQCPAVGVESQKPGSLFLGSRDPWYMSANILNSGPISHLDGWPAGKAAHVWVAAPLSANNSQALAGGCMVLTHVLPCLVDCFLWIMKAAELCLLLLADPLLYLNV
jgi:hypothetical protein